MRRVTRRLPASRELCCRRAARRLSRTPAAQAYTGCSPATQSLAAHRPRLARLPPSRAAIASASRELQPTANVDERQPVSVIASEASKLDRYVSNIEDLGADEHDQPIEIGDMSVDLFRRLVTKGDREIHLTPKEFAVLAE